MSKQTEYLSIKTPGPMLALPGPADKAAMSSLVNRINAARKADCQLLEVEIFVTDPFGEDPETQNIGIAIADILLTARMHKPGPESHTKTRKGVLVPVPDRIV